MSYQPPQGPPGPPQPPQWPQSPPQPPQGQQPAWGQPGYQPPPKPPQKPIYRRGWFIALAVVVGLLVLGNVLGEDSTPTGADEPATEETTEAPANETTASTARKAGVVLLEASGTANGNSKKFRSAGDWDLAWSVNCDGDGFVSINPEGDAYLIGPTTDKTAKGVEHYHEAGSFYFQVIGGPNCSWTLNAVTA